MTTELALTGGIESALGTRYAVEREIARGGMATVYLATQMPLGRPVALKVLSLPTEPEESDGLIERFRLEAQSLAQLTHPNIVVIHDYGETPDGRFFLAMEHLDGVSLAEVFRHGRLSINRALPMLIQICAGLRYAHRRGVVHRDLKPSNVIMLKDDDGSDRVKLVDFGLVKVMESETAITRQGIILGSPQFMAPEQIQGEGTDHRADIYSFGVILYRALTGRYPFSAADSRGVMESHLYRVAPKLADAAPNQVFPQALEDVVARCLAKLPDDRFADMTELMTTLNPIVGDEYRSGITSSGSMPSLSGSQINRRPVSRPPSGSHPIHSTRSMSSLSRSGLRPDPTVTLPWGTSAVTALWGIIGLGTALSGSLGLAAIACLAMAVWALTHPTGEAAGTAPATPAVAVAPTPAAAPTVDGGRTEGPRAAGTASADPREAPASAAPNGPTPAVDAGAARASAPSTAPAPQAARPRARTVAHSETPASSDAGSAALPASPPDVVPAPVPDGYFGLPDDLRTPK